MAPGPVKALEKKKKKKKTPQANGTREEKTLNGTLKQKLPVREGTRSPVPVDANDTPIDLILTPPQAPVRQPTALSPEAVTVAPTCPRCKRRRRVAVYGGAFDPVTNGHLSCAAEIVHSGIADEVLMVPCGPRPDKPNMSTTAMDRYVMLQIAVNTSFSPGFPVRVSDIEIYEPRAMATYDLLSSLRERNLGVDYMFVVGSDWLQSGQDLRQWKSKGGSTGDQLVQEFDFLIIKRPGYDLPNDLSIFGPRFSELSLPHGMNYVDSSISSTEIRRRVAVSQQVRSSLSHNASTSADGLLPTGVLAYIQRAGLYGSHSYQR
eukprot:TRINITY_DN3220_c0_g3_i1.p1 TRINITY_DN3220_c0_g3~~TRINITY_DN3220_c0_g3_i1.p1  ORF type:complete len:337 (+),score=93.87 TRINITY_DN3220_c0_g3_i1:57-1013(+)